MIKLQKIFIILRRQCSRSVFSLHCNNKKMLSLWLTATLTVFLLLFVSAPLTEGQSPIRVLYPSKNAYIDVSTFRDGYAVITVNSRVGRSMRFTLHVSNPTLNKLIGLRKCGTHTVCILSNRINHTAIVIDPEKEFITITRKLPEMNDQGKMIDCIDLKISAEWMGGPEYRYQFWPIKQMFFDEEAYIPRHQKNMAITERYWLNSRGIYVRASPYSPMFLDQNNYKDNKLCFITENKAPYSQSGELNAYYEIGILNNSRLAHEYVINKYFSKPSGHPDELMIQHPIWSTWARYKGDIRKETIDNFTNEITNHGFNHSQVEIDDNWETCYGSALFDSQKFPNISQAIRTLKSKGFRVTLWIHPFINYGCEPAYSTALNNSYFVKNAKGEVHTSWWRGSNSAIIDFTNTKAIDWWIGRLKEIEKLGIDSFKFDAGETTWLPQIPVLSAAPKFQPGIYTKSYVTALAKNFNSMMEVRVGWESQDLPIFVRMNDRDSRYSWNNGLPTLITTLIQMNLAGYIYVLPDMIGGNGYPSDKVDDIIPPSKDLFIRWLQATVFMPAMQFSFTPWDFDNETITIAKKYVNLHAEITPTILRLMNNSMTTGAPLNPPIWWVDPEDQEAYKIYDEFLLGEEILVAPVIAPNSMKRDIYLPKGVWNDGNDASRQFIGPLWLRNFEAPLDVLPYFIKTT